MRSLCQADSSEREPESSKNRGLFHQPGLGSIVLSVWLFAGAASALGQQTAPADLARIEPADVFALVTRVKAEVELIRVEMGRPEESQSPVSVSDAAPREVYFQARTLFTKARRLDLELTHESGPLPAPPDTELTPAHVYSMVQAALAEIERCKSELGISRQVTAAPRDPTRTPTDVFREIVQVNRQLNTLLDRPFAPSDVYEQVTLAISYSASLLATFPGAPRIPEAPVLERGKNPVDVLRLLLACFESVQKIARRSGVKILKLNEIHEEGHGVRPGDVYDVATLLVSELAYLHRRRAGTEPPIESYYPGRTFPSHVYQRAGILEAQLIQLLSRVEADPQWLKGSGVPLPSSR